MSSRLYEQGLIYRQFTHDPSRARRPCLFLYGWYVHVGNEHGGRVRFAQLSDDNQHRGTQDVVLADISNIVLYVCYIIVGFFSGAVTVSNFSLEPFRSTDKPEHFRTEDSALRWDIRIHAIHCFIVDLSGERDEMVGYTGWSCERLL